MTLPEDVEAMLRNLRHLRDRLAEWSNHGPDEPCTATSGGVQATATLREGVRSVDVDEFWFGHTPIERVAESLVEAIDGAEQRTRHQLWDLLVGESIVDEKLRDADPDTEITDLLPFPERFAQRTRTEDGAE